MLAIYQRLDQLKQQMIVLAHDPIRAEYARLDHLFKREYNQLQQHHQNERQKRKLLRQSLTEAEQKDLDRVSQSQKKSEKTTEGKMAGGLTTPRGGDQASRSAIIRSKTRI